MAAFDGVRRLNSMEQRETFVECANDIDDLFLSVYEKDMRFLQRLLRVEDARDSSLSEGKWKRQGIFVKLEEDLDDSFDSEKFRNTLKESSLKRSLYVKRASIKKRFEVARMCHAQLRGLVEDRGYPLYPTAGETGAALPQLQPPKKCVDVHKMDEHMNVVISFMDSQLKLFLTDTIHNLELIRDEINKVINEFYHRLEVGELTLRENANKRQIYSKLESFEGDKVSIELSLSFFRECYMKIDADTMKLLGGRLMSVEEDTGSAMEESEDTNDFNYSGTSQYVGDDDGTNYLRQNEEDLDMNIESSSAAKLTQKRNSSDKRSNSIEIHRTNETTGDRSHGDGIKSFGRQNKVDKYASQRNMDTPYDRGLYSFPRKASRPRQFERGDSGDIYDDHSLRNIQRAIDEVKAQKAPKSRRERKRYTNDLDWDWNMRQSPFGMNSLGGFF